jgi:hypothetical protein
MGELPTPQLDDGAKDAKAPRPIGGFADEPGAFFE